MALLNTAHVRALLNPPAPPCISLYMPTHRGAPDRREEPIRFKNLVRRAEELLRAKYPDGKAHDLLKPFEALTLDTAFWSGTQDGLAAFGAADFFAAHRLPRTMPERVTVADSFHLKPLFRYTQSSDRFHVLGVTRTETFLYEGDRYGLRRLDTAGLIPTFDEAVGTDLTNPDRTKIDRGARGESTGHYSGHGARKDELGKDTERFFRAVDRAVTDNVSEPAKVPLVLACLPEHQTEFRTISKNPHLLADGVAADPGALSPEKLRAAAWAAFEPRFRQRLARLTEDFGTAFARQKGADLVADVARACRDGRVGTLLVDADKALPGTVDLTTGEVRFAPPGDPAGEDLIDDMAELALKSGGDVVVVPHDRMPTDTGLAAIFRF